MDSKFLSLSLAVVLVTLDLSNSRQINFIVEANGLLANHFVGVEGIRHSIRHKPGIHCND